MLPALDKIFNLIDAMTGAVAVVCFALHETHRSELVALLKVSTIVAVELVANRRPRMTCLQQQDHSRPGEHHRRARCHSTLAD